MTNSDSVLKSRDITLPTKVHIVKTMFFLVVMDGCELDHREGWAPRKWCFWIVVLEKTLESSLDRKEIKPVNFLKEIDPENSFKGLMLKLKLKLHYVRHQMWRANSLEKTLMLGKIEGKRRKWWQRMRYSDGISDSMDMSLSKLRETVKDRQAWHAAIHGTAKSWTWLSDETATTTTTQR